MTCNLVVVMTLKCAFVQSCQGTALVALDLMKTCGIWACLAAGLLSRSQVVVYMSTVVVAMMNVYPRF